MFSEHDVLSNTDDFGTLCLCSDNTTCDRDHDHDRDHT